MKIIHIATALLLISAMAEPTNTPTRSIQTDADKLYGLRSLICTSDQVPCIILFHCYIEDQFLGATSLVILDETDAELLVFWKPIIKKISEGIPITLEARGGRFIYTVSAADDTDKQSGWTSYAPAVQPRRSDLRLLPDNAIQP
jgi:hypothetical protein